ncbi:BamA/TamA family outer membrane protein [Zavarzinia compransoris]|uniref:ShlB/FhaC/HecB family hemolysin secretion/activation protein n=1 Tax=Zavarzinia marina TaxID=2911065 RepID=UPI001F39CE8B|nr:ShlB/FhaC/HecB family hemolysin secretion/activation protein [Zavarzinia marina]MCF4165179.1 BamA/TamA family outer membrane protein [Zavarzinia marina]
MTRSVVGRKAEVSRCHSDAGPGRPWFGMSMLAIALALPVAATAQTVPDAARPTVSPEVLSPALAPAAPAIDLVTAPAGTPPAGAESYHFTLTEVAVEGVGAYDADTIAAFFADRIGTDVSLADVFAIAAAIETYYRADGYFLTRVVVPAQRIENGRVKLLVVEGFVKSVAVVGEAGGALGLVQSMADRIVETPGPTRLDTIERQLLLINDLPGLVARGTLSPAAGERGASILTIEVVRKKVDGFFSVDNRSPEFLGPWSAALGVGANSFTGLAERLEFVGYSSLFSTRQQLFQLSAQGTLSPDGLRLRAYASRAPGNPGDQLAPLALETVAERYGLSLSYPLLRGRRLSLTTDIAFDWTDEDDESLGVRIVEDHLRVLRLGLNGEYRDSLNGISDVEFGLHVGLDAFGASEAGDANLSRAGADGTFVKATLEIGRLQRLFTLGDGTVDLQMLAAGQVSDGPLLADEEFRLGGFRLGRGFTSGEISGDSALAGSLELQYTSVLDEAVEGGRFHLPFQLYGFYDVGKVWDDGPGEPESAALTSAGGGIRLFVADVARAEVEVAKPLTRDRADRGEDPRRPGVFFRFVGSF